MNNADQLAEIRPGLREAIAGGENTCATFEVEECEEKWIQFVGKVVNSAYFSSQEPQFSTIPSSVLSKLKGVKLTSWEANNYFTVEVGELEIDALGQLLDWIFTNFLGCTAGEYHVSVELEDL